MPTPNNTRAIDFECEKCHAPFQLKASRKAFSGKVVDGAYASMMSAVKSAAVPHLLLMQYSLDTGVSHLQAIPSGLIVPHLIERRNPLSTSARRAGWIGCNILISAIPSFGRVDVIRNSTWMDQYLVRESFRVAQRLSSGSVLTRSWLVTVGKIVDELPDVFLLNDVYSYENALMEKFPSNRNVRAKIRQQLQILRDKGRIAFLGAGMYQKVC